MLPAFAQDSASPDAQFAATFRCPEFLEDAERDGEVFDLLKWAGQHHPDWTTDQVWAYRMRLLEQHHCEETLEEIRTSAPGAPIKAVTVRDAEFAVVRSLDANELSTFESNWNAKDEAPVSFGSVGGKHFKLDITGGGDGRWLYQTTGYTTRLSKTDTPVYKIKNVEDFNKLIGAQAK